MRLNTTTPHGRGAGFIAAAASAAFLLAGCAGARPAESGSPASGAPPVAATAIPVGSGTTIDPSGDADLDRLDGDLSAFEQENLGLDQAAAATQEK